MARGRGAQNGGGGLSQRGGRGRGEGKRGGGGMARSCAFMNSKIMVMSNVQISPFAFSGSFTHTIKLFYS